jgi:hypothetical protein
VGAAGKTDPSFAAVDPSADSEHSDQPDEAEAVDPVNRGQQFVVVDDRHDKHRHQAGGDPEDLHALEAVELGVEGGAVDFKNADDGEEQDEGEERPVEIAEGEEAAHRATKFPQTGSGRGSRRGISIDYRIWRQGRRG